MSFAGSIPVASAGDVMDMCRRCGKALLYIQPCHSLGSLLDGERPVFFCLHCGTKYIGIPAISATEGESWIEVLPNIPRKGTDHHV